MMNLMDKKAIITLICSWEQTTRRCPPAMSAALAPCSTSTAVGSGLPSWSITNMLTTGAPCLRCNSLAATHILDQMVGRGGRRRKGRGRRKVMRDRSEGVREREVIWREEEVNRREMKWWEKRKKRRGRREGRRGRHGGEEGADWENL